MKMEKILGGKIEVDSTFDNLNKCFEIARNLKITDIIKPSNEQIGEIAELLYRLQQCPDFEILDYEGFEA